MKKLVLLLFASLLFLKASAMDDARMMRYPDINGNLIAFVYAGDIWTVNATGGTARRVTSHPGTELFPKISPDGKWIAFSAEYSGSRQIWVMPSEGGTARQLTFYNSVGVMPPRGGFDNVVLDWTPDSKRILFRANRTSFGDRNGRYFTVALEGGFEEPLPIVNGGFATFSPDGKQLCFTPVDREFRTWKRYKGGRATELWTYDLANNRSKQITQWAGSDQWPVWHGNHIFYASDRDSRLNIWRYDISTGENEQITRHGDFDVMWPSGRNGKLVYENGGYLYLLDLASGDSHKITVAIHYDNPNLQPYFRNVKNYISSFSLSPSGKRALFEARGDIYSVPVEKGEIQNLTNTQGVREISPVWSPDGKQIAYYSDATGEYELYLLENKEGATPRQVTRGSAAWKHTAEWSPRSTHLVYSDRTMKLWLVDISSNKQTAIDEATAEEISDYSFSPDGDWIAYSKSSPNDQSALWVYQISSGRKYQLTDDTFSDSDPVFSRDGKFLFFLSNRDFNLAFSSFEFDYLYNNATRIYALPLRDDGTTLSPYKEDREPYNDEKEDNTRKKEKDNTEKEDSKDNDTQSSSGEKKVTIDIENASNRIQALPLQSGNYSIVGAVEEGLLYSAGNKIMRYNINEAKTEEILDGTGWGILAADRKSFIYRSGNNWGVAKNQTGQPAGTGTINLDNLNMRIDPRAEWNQIYADAFRIFRDYFYVNNLHGVDWKAIRKNYGALLPYVPSRFDLDYILNEIVSETNTGHSYVDWGDIARVDRINGGLLGAELEADLSAKRYKIRKIYPGENWNESRRSPLTESGVNVKEGDYIIRINGQELTTAQNPYELLENLGDRYIELTVNSSPSGSGAKSYNVKTITSEQELRYMDWVNQRREMVDRLSGGRIGYIHVPNTAVEGNRELFRGMYAYHHKEALIIDDRYNGGGFIPDRMIDLLNRRTLAYWHRNGLTQPMKSPGIAHDGPKAMLINGYSSSGGDAFPYFFRKTGEGKLIGTRTWGGLVGISGNARLVDGGYISVPRFGIYDQNGEWIIEGIGVYPDIEVVDRPEELAKGNDPSIEKAVELLLEELKANPRPQVTPPAPPDRSKWIEVEIK
ncbi:S41 family peptidase [Proteiniphilum sp.]|uniref:S41 family peptidase n=1 Tax=Proteiniphilum sp. TaxID=1926877 RepID=UPI002B202542|nr:PDZ domain-containing protein [Proteiniphilum sp.]MEA4918533.1 PDZ domain-containing protein [Proteiniphilum sp.]